ncbi:MAG: trehalose-phosphatase [Pseudomonadota bacterium]
MITLDGLRLQATDAVFLDFDGTLVELGPDPDTVWLPEDLSPALSTLSQALGGAVAVISGRDIRDLAQRVPGFLWRAGGHGLEIVPPGEEPGPEPPPPPTAVLTPLRRALDHPGVRLELKGPVAALHFRAAPAAEAACLSAAEAAAVDGYRVLPGKCVVEVKPAGADKGRALARMVEHLPFAGRRPVILGDDTTDEDAMEVAQSLGGIGVKVGEGNSVAHRRAPDPVAVRNWLAHEATRLSR